MARVDLKPNYLGTTLARLLAWPVAGNDEELFDKICRLAGVSRSWDIATGEARAKKYAALMDEDPEEWRAYDLENADTPGHAPGSVGAGFYVDLKAKKAKVPLANEALAGILTGTCTIASGIDAAVALSERLSVNAIPRSSDRSSRAAYAQRATTCGLTLQANYCFQSSNAITAASRFATHGRADGHVPADMLRRAATRGPGASVRRDLMDLRGRVHTHGCHLEASKPADRFRVDAPWWKDVFKSRDMWYISGVYVLSIGDAALVLTRSDLDSCEIIMRNYANLCDYAMHHRRIDTVAGDGPSMSVRLAVVESARRLMSHCAAQAKTGKDPALVTRACYLAWQAKVQELPEDDPKLSAMAGNHAAEIRAEATDCYASWRTITAPLDRETIPPVEALDWYRFYAIMASTDFDLQWIRDRVASCSSRVIKPDPTTYERYKRFVCAYDVVCFANTRKRMPRLGGDAPPAKWVSKIVKGTFAMPDESLWGKFWIEGEFEYQDYSSSWFLAAKDATHFSRRYHTTPDITNELVAALQQGEIADLGMTANELREACIAHDLPGATTLYWAAKAENTKHRDKVRLTASADAAFRRVQSEIDRNIRRAGETVPGSVIGKSTSYIAKQLSKIADSTAMPGRTIVSSHDVTAWSESQDRTVFLETQEYELRKTNIANPRLGAVLWTTMRSVVSRMGYTAWSEYANGGIQGFPGSQDTITHSHILAFALQIARENNITSGPAVGHTCIDDVVIKMTIKDPRCSVGETAHALRDSIADTYEKLGYKIDNVKSFLSDVKFIFLNQLFYKGVMVPLGLKTFIKLGPLRDAAISCITEEVGGIFSTAQGALTAGTDPVFAYCAAFRMATDLYIATSSRLREVPPDALGCIALCPIAEGGWGFPTLLDFCAGTSTDRHVVFNSLIAMACRGEVHPDALEMFGAIKIQPIVRSSPATRATSIFEYRRRGAVTPAEIRRHACLDSIQENELAEPFRTIYAMDTREVKDELMTRCMTATAIDAVVWSEFAADLPTAMLDTLAIRLSSTKAIANMVHPRELRKLRAIVNSASHQHAAHAADLWQMAAPGLVDPWEMSGTARTVEEREAAYALSGMQVLNHTYPSPCELIRITTEDLRVAGRVTFASHATRSISECRSLLYRRAATENMHGYTVSVASAGVMKTNVTNMELWHPLDANIFHCAASIAWASIAGYDVSSLLSVASGMWGFKDTNAFRHLCTGISASSPKRAQSNPTSRVHPVNLLRCVYRAVSVDLSDAWPAVGDSGTMHDYLATVHVLRVGALLAAYLSAASGGSEIAWNATINKEAVLAYDHDPTCYMWGEDLGESDCHDVLANVPTLTARRDKIRETFETAGYSTADTGEDETVPDYAAVPRLDVVRVSLTQAPSRMGLMSTGVRARVRPRRIPGNVCVNYCVAACRALYEDLLPQLLERHGMDAGDVYALSRDEGTDEHWNIVCRKSFWEPIWRAWDDAIGSERLAAVINQLCSNLGFGGMRLSRKPVLQSFLSRVGMDFTGTTGLDSGE